MYYFFSWDFFLGFPAGQSIDRVVSKLPRSQSDNQRTILDPFFDNFSRIGCMYLFHSFRYLPWMNCWIKQCSGAIGNISPIDHDNILATLGREEMALRLNTGGTPTLHLVGPGSVSQLTPEEQSRAEELFEAFCQANSLKNIAGYFQRLCECVKLRPNDYRTFYTRLKERMCFSWKWRSFQGKLDKRAGQKDYGKGTYCAGNRVSWFFLVDLFDWFIDWWVNRSFDRSIVRLIDCLIEWLNDWLKAFSFFRVLLIHFWKLDFVSFSGADNWSRSMWSAGSHWVRAPGCQSRRFGEAGPFFPKQCAAFVAVCHHRPP